MKLKHFQISINHDSRDELAETFVAGENKIVIGTANKAECEDDFLGVAVEFDPADARLFAQMILRAADEAEAKE